MFFVYGTLTDREGADRVLDTYTSRGRATLVGRHRVEDANTGSASVAVPGDYLCLRVRGGAGALPQ